MNGALKNLLALKNMDYLVVNKELIITDKSEGIERFAEAPEEVAQGEDIRVAFPELIGTEEILSQIIAGEQVNFDLKGISDRKSTRLNSSHT